MASKRDRPGREKEAKVKVKFPFQRERAAIKQSQKSIKRQELPMDKRKAARILREARISVEKMDRELQANGFIVLKEKK